MKTFVTLFVILSITVTMGAQELVEYSFEVKGTCAMCKERIEKAALEEGIASTADWDFDTKILVVIIDESVTSINFLRNALAEVGHDNGNFQASDEVYDNLHECCKYRPEVALVEGYIFAMEDGIQVPLIGASINFENTAKGTTTDATGYFQIPNPENHEALAVSYIGFEDQSVPIREGIMEVTLADGVELDVVEISYREKTSRISFVNPLNVETISREELTKAACCNLSESFETNPSVDVSFNDAVTGTKQIQLLGLAGPYVQITRELMPDVKGLNSLYGLNSIPGPWIQNIQLIKGTGSVVNGFESITGQINVELKKPDQDEILHVNGYINNGGRLELNSNFRTSITDKLSTGVLVHGKSLRHPHDRNDDGFTDMPMENNFIVANRWRIESDFGLLAQVGVKYTSIHNSGGYHDHFTGVSKAHETHWRMNTDIRRLDLWSKVGYIWPSNPERSIGLQLGSSIHEQESEFGFSRYNADENTLYGNLIFQNIFSNGHTLRTGLTYQRDDIGEIVDKAGFFTRVESVPGAYIEYTLKSNEKWSIIPGLRVDHHNTYGTFVTPRLHAKYNLSDQSILRFTAGRGQRTANIFADNIGLFATNRSVIIRGGDTNTTPYGLDPEVAWNYGVNFTHGLRLAERELVIAVDAYRTDFENQIVVDYETTRQVSFYNLNGKSYSNSFQVKADYELVNNLDLRVAYRFFDVQSTFEGSQLEKPLISRHRAFANATYNLNDKWHFDLTLNWRGAQRLPDTSSNPEQYRVEAYSPSYFLTNGQISRRWGNKWDIYLGAENIFNYKQPNAIIGSDEPLNNEFFDASIVWAPLFGANVYLGFRYNLERE